MTLPTLDKDGTIRFPIRVESGGGTIGDATDTAAPGTPDYAAWMKHLPGRHDRLRALQRHRRALAR